MSAEGGSSKEVDVLVVGSGAGGFASAFSARAAGFDVLMIEKGAKYGGSAAFSGGGAWIPNHPAKIAKGGSDDRDEVLVYLKTITKGQVPEARLARYVDEAPKMAKLIMEQGPYLSDAFEWYPGYPDYHPSLRGADLRGRGVWPKPLDLRKLGDDAKNLNIRSMTRGTALPKGAWMTSLDLHDVVRLRWKGGAFTATKAMVRLAWRIFRYRVMGERMISSGLALITRFRLTANEKNIPLWLETPMKRLIVEDGKVVGAVVDHEGKELEIRARKGVILATGGFDYNPEMRKEYQPEVEIGWSTGNPINTGDGHRAGMEIGAATQFMDDAWWMPCWRGPTGDMMLLLVESQNPRQFIVNQAGKRFVSEPAPYTDFGHAQIDGHRTGVGHIPCYMIFDSVTVKKNFIFGQLPGRSMSNAVLEKGVAVKADTIEELAEKIGVPGDVLKETQARFNGFAAKGVDDDFRRGESAYENYYGDPSLKNPNLAPVDTPPYYAVRIVPGDLGTKGGLVCNENAQVLREDGSVIQGLYATGNVSAALMANDYAGPGATIGPAMTFAYVAVRHMAGDYAGRPAPANPEAAASPAG